MATRAKKVKTENNGGSTGKGFKPGVSGNPGGRPKMPEELREAFEKASQEALRTLIEVMRTGKGMERVKASEIILDRSYGKPVQQVDAKVDATVKPINTDNLNPKEKELLASLAIKNMGLDD